MPRASAGRPGRDSLQGRCRRQRVRGLPTLAGFVAAGCLAAQRAVAGAPVDGTISARVMSYSGVFGSVALDCGMGFLCFFVYALTAGAETAITTLWPWKVRELAQREADEGKAGMWSALRQDLQRFLQTILIAATISSVLGVALVTEVSGAVLGPSGLMVATVGLTMWQLVMCEIVPKSVAVLHALPFCQVILPIVYRLSAVIYPVGKYINRFVELLLRLVGISADASKAPLVSEEELDLIFSSAVKSGVVEANEGKMILNVRNLDSKRVKEVMTALVDMTCIPATAPVAELQKLWLRTKFSRIPVFQDRVDRIVGVVNSEALLEHMCGAGDAGVALSEDRTTMEQICEKAFFVPETMSLQTALECLKDRKMAICVDELGGTAGLVTLEDVMEEIVGEVYDPDKEKDTLERTEHSSMIQRLEEGRYAMNAAAAFQELVEHVRLERTAPLLQVPPVAMLLAGSQAPSMALPGVADAYSAPASRPGPPSSSFQEPLEPAVSAAITTATESQGSLVSILREHARGRGRRGIDRVPTPLAEEAFRCQLLRWLQVRQLDKLLRRAPERDFDGSQFWSYEPSCRVLQAGPGWQLGYHGTWWYFLWSILEGGVLLESQDEGAGHEFWLPGLYVTTKFETAVEYARSHRAFGDGMYHRVLLELLFDPQEVRRQRERGGVQIVLPSKAVSLQGVHFLPNRPPSRGEERLDTWDCSLEAVPPGCPRPAEVDAGADPGKESEGTVIWHPPAAA